MAITATDQRAINHYLINTGIDSLYYLDLCAVLNKKKKPTMSEFLDYFVSDLLKEFRKDVSINLKRTCKVIHFIDCFICWCKEDGEDISESTLDKIRALKDFYNDYLQKNNLESYKEISEWLEIVLSRVNELYPCSSSSIDSSIASYLNQIDDLEAQIKRLKRELGDATKRYETLNALHDTKLKMIETLKAENTDLSSGIEGYRDEVSKLSRNIECLEQKISELELLLAQSAEERSKLESFKSQCESLQSEVKRLQGLVDLAENSRQMAENMASRKSLLEELIYQKLLVDNSNVDDLKNYLSTKGIEVTRTEVMETLNELKQRINFSVSFSTHPIYKVAIPELLTDVDLPISLDRKCKYIDIVLDSDMHIDEFSKEVLAGFDALGNYCVKIGASLCVNLGDLFQGFSSVPPTYKNSKKNYKLVHEAISLIPTFDGVYQAIMGGNHSRNIANYGYNPIKMLTDARSDFIYLGFNHATLSFHKNSSLLGKIDLHHPDSYGCLVRQTRTKFDENNIMQYLQDVYVRQGRKRDDSFIDIFGHTHRSVFNMINSYCHLPAFFRGKGACRLRLYFKDEDEISYAVFTPLHFNGKELIETGEIVYQKVKRMEPK